MDKMENLWVILALISAFFFGLRDIIAKKYFSEKSKFTPKDAVFFEYFFLLLLVLIIFLPQINFLSFVDMYFLYILKAFSVAIASYFYFYLLKKYDISLVSPLINLSPLVLYILSTIFLAEVVTPIQLLGVLVIIGATYYLEVVIHHHDKKDPHKHHVFHLNKVTKSFDVYFYGVGLLLLIILSLAAISDRLILMQVDVGTNIFFTALFVLVGLLAYEIKEGKFLLGDIKKIKEEPKILFFSAAAVASTFFVLKAISIPSALISLIIPLRRTSTLFSSLVGGMLFHEKHLPKKLIATGLMVVGVVLIVL